MIACEKHMPEREGYPGERCYICWLLRVADASRRLCEWDTQQRARLQGRPPDDCAMATTIEDLRYLLEIEPKPPLADSPDKS
uniref:Uncharacterized protein n=1 Tax=viral metagenome TaxID=1070528 RepID=A0A6M3LB10_9ZZZZ